MNGSARMPIEQNERTVSTGLALNDRLPLTCTRAGTCCHGKSISVNPWELALLARTLAQDLRTVRDTHTQDGGIRLRMNGEHRWRGRAACTFYQHGQGCTVHPGRPLACRLYPLGRERRGEQVRFIHEGRIFPCLDGCLEVTELPSMTVGDYLAGQDIDAGANAQDSYLEVVQDLAEGSFVLLFDTPLHAADTGVLKAWERMARLSGDERAKQLGKSWIDTLTLASGDPHAPVDFIHDHRESLRARAEKQFGNLDDLGAVRHGCEVMMLLACHLGASLGAEPADLMNTWIATARANGAVG